MLLAEQLASLDFETLRLEVAESILTVTADRPEALNSVSPQMLSDLREVFGLLRERLGQDQGTGSSEGPDWSIRGVILTGAGKAFIAGADISEMRNQSPDEARAYAAESHELASWIESLAVPVVAAVNGFALGGGCEFAMACDYIFASEKASFGQPEVALGLIPGFGGCVRLQQHVGVAAARELILTGRRIDAREAEHLGLVLRVLSDTDALLAAAHESLRLAAAQSPTAVEAAKRTVNAVQSRPTDEGLAIELDAFAARFGTADMVEGTTAFLEKRTPEFPGR